MKKYILLLIWMPMFLISCNREKIEVFHGTSQIYFDKFYMDALKPGTKQADSTVMSFFFFPEDTKEIEVPLVVQFSGVPLTSDLKFGLKVVKEATTANADEYKLDEYYTFHAKPIVPEQLEIKDTIHVKLLYTDRLKTLEGGVRLVVELVPMEGLELGQYERRRAVIISTALESRPEWWTQEVEITLLGRYSQKKYKLFLQHADPKGELNEELITNRPDLAIEYVLRFKKWLTDNPGQTDEYGEITVEI
ncbi:DUF4843 domain-containing protein [Gabonibacter chumensis]|uniref:DUF4843 domain-containing protein n=1 Tax=Gabonibacter chumensis TaxID=2972474 RepID=UPI0025739A8E|nr:DUF4843 domain-containing protein [Gabonibacter chumensis]MCR9011018.1 DUF4843 domain-containing protein [Gabonibacter chumensis]